MENPYDKLLQRCANSIEIQTEYEEHRQSRNLQQRAKLSSPNSRHLEPDPILQSLLQQDLRPQFNDPRHNLVFWARPTGSVRSLINDIQHRLLSVAPSLWLMPLDCLHMTVLEIIHSTTAPVVQELLNTLRPKLQYIVDYPSQHPVRLVKPLLGFDASALALTFVPAASEGNIKSNEDIAADSYSYHHLRRDLYELSKSTGVEIASRYTALSAHLTIARFTSETDFTMDNDENSIIDMSRMKTWLSCIDSINDMLQEKHWPDVHDDIRAGAEWVVGQEKGLECRIGTCWYGGGETFTMGKNAET